MKRALFFLCLAGLAWAEPKLVEQDQAVKDPSFQAYRQRLLETVRRHDLKALRAALDPKIQYSFGIETPGPDGFLKAWKANRPDTQLWKELEEVLVHGGSFDQNHGFVAPWIYANWPEKYDSIEYVAVLGDKVPIQLKADGASPVLAEVGHTMLKRNRSEDKDYPGWTQVDLPDGSKTGFIRNSAIRGGLDFRAVFEKKKGKWLMTTFIGGD